MHTTLGNQLVLAGFTTAACAFIVVLFFYLRLRHHIAKEKLERVEDGSLLWAYAPPSTVLTDQGLRYCRYRNVSFVIMLIAGATDAVVAKLQIQPRPIILFVTIATSLFASVLFESRLKHHVSMDAVRDTEDVAGLWKFGGVPAAILDEAGRRLNQWKKAAVGAFFIGMGVVALGIIVYGIPVEQG